MQDAQKDGKVTIDNEREKSMTAQLQTELAREREKNMYSAVHAEIARLQAGQQNES